MSSRTFSAVLLGCIAVLAGCSGGPSSDAPTVTEADPTAFTISYRSHVRLPKDGEVLTAESFATQIRAKDPVSTIRCGAEESAAYSDISAFLGGISWSHPVAIVKDSSLPRLYDGKYTEVDYAESPSAGASDSSAAPTIERPDLIGVQNGIAVFLSKQHGLMAVREADDHQRAGQAFHHITGGQWHAHVHHQRLAAAVDAQAITHLRGAGIDITARLGGVHRAHVVQQQPAGCGATTGQQQQQAGQCPGIERLPGALPRPAERAAIKIGDFRGLCRDEVVLQSGVVVLDHRDHRFAGLAQRCDGAITQCGRHRVANGILVNTGVTGERCGVRCGGEAGEEGARGKSIE